jgi:hypothetical protein
MSNADLARGQVRANLLALFDPEMRGGVGEVFDAFVDPQREQKLVAQASVPELISGELLSELISAATHANWEKVPPDLRTRFLTLSKPAARREKTCRVDVTWAMLCLQNLLRNIVAQTFGR